MATRYKNFKIVFEWVGQITDQGHPVWVNAKTGDINWRSPTDVCRHKDGHLLCKAGHNLVKFTPTRGFMCDICTKTQPQNICLMGCRKCNADLCADCYRLIEKNFKPIILANPVTIKPKSTPIDIPINTAPLLSATPTPFSIYDPPPHTRDLILRQRRWSSISQTNHTLIQKHVRAYLTKKTFIKLKNKKKFAIAKIQINHARTSDGETPLLAAIRNSNYDIVKALLTTGANVDAVATNGDTPLLMAIEKKNLELVKLLIKGGANLGLVNKKGETPLFKACSINNKEIVNIILNV